MIYRVIDPPGITIYCQALNLDQPSRALIAELDAVAACIAGGGGSEVEQAVRARLAING